MAKGFIKKTNFELNHSGTCWTQVILFQGYPAIFTLVYKFSNPTVEYTTVHSGQNKWKADISLC